MSARFRNAIAGVTALIAFMLIGGRLINSFAAWGCDCLRSECVQCASNWTEISEHDYRVLRLFGSVETAQSDGKFYVVSDAVNDAPITVTDDTDDTDWGSFHAARKLEAEFMFDTLFNSYETKRAKNGAMMIRQGNRGSYKFAKKG